MKSYAKNIDEFIIGQTLWDKKNNYGCVIKEKSANSIKLFFNKQTKHGIDCENWFDMYSFSIRFSKDVPDNYKKIGKEKFENNLKKVMVLEEVSTFKALAPENKFKNVEYKKW